MWAPRPFNLRSGFIRRALDVPLVAGTVRKDRFYIAQSSFASYRRSQNHRLHGSQEQLGHQLQGHDTNVRNHTWSAVRFVRDSVLWSSIRSPWIFSVHRKWPAPADVQRFPHLQRCRQRNRPSDPTHVTTSVCTYYSASRPKKIAIQRYLTEHPDFNN